MQSRDYDIGVALEAAFDLIRKKPVWMLVWGAFLFVLPMLPIIPIVMMVIENYETIESSPENFGDALATNMMSNAASIIQFVAAVPIVAAITRYVLTKQPSRFAGLKVGMDEIWVFVIFIAAYFAMVIAIMIAMIPAAIIGLMIYLGTQNEAVSLLIGFLLGLVCMLPLIWVSVRLSLIIAASIDLNTFAIAQAWKATKGKFWPLFGTCIIMLLIGLAVSVLMLVMLMLIGGLVFLLGSGVGWVSNAPLDTWNWWPMLGLGGLLLVIPMCWASGVSYAFYFAPFASAWQQLKPLPVEAATTVAEPSELQG